MAILDSRRLVQPSSGNVKVLGSDPRAPRKQIGYMFARLSLLPWRSAERNVEYGLELRGVSGAERRRLSDQYLEMVGLGAYKGNYPSQLAQGLRQRVALARTWALAPKVLFMDESFAALDAQTRESLHGGFLDGWQNQQQSVDFVTYDLSEAIAIADRLIVFAHGEIAREFEALLTIELGRPAGNRLSCAETGEQRGQCPLGLCRGAIGLQHPSGQLPHSSIGLVAILDLVQSDERGHVGPASGSHHRQCRCAKRGGLLVDRCLHDRTIEEIGHDLAHQRVARATADDGHRAADTCQPPQFVERDAQAECDAFE
jgi:ABC-type nitrate/sulfonate/bicarbonate transport system ATPase subunit